MLKTFKTFTAVFFFGEIIVEMIEFDDERFIVFRILQKSTLPLYISLIKDIDKPSIVDTLFKNSQHDTHFFGKKHFFS